MGARIGRGAAAEKRERLAAQHFCGPFSVQKWQMQRNTTDRNRGIFPVVPAERRK